MLQSIITYIRKSLLTKRFSHCLTLPKKFSVRQAKVTLGRLKQNSWWQHLTISILFVLNIFIKNLLITKSIEDICELFDWLIDWLIIDHWSLEGSNIINWIKPCRFRRPWVIFNGRFSDAEERYCVHRWPSCLYLSRNRSVKGRYGSLTSQMPMWCRH